VGYKHWSVSASIHTVEIRVAEVSTCAVDAKEAKALPGRDAEGQVVDGCEILPAGLLLAKHLSQVPHDNLQADRPRGKSDQMALWGKCST